MHTGNSELEMSIMHTECPIIALITSIRNCSYLVCEYANLISSFRDVIIHHFGFQVETTVTATPTGIVHERLVDAEGLSKINVVQWHPVVESKEMLGKY
jgi:hypothetical protein